jgi:low temperature requirement protein LtrA
MNDNLSSHALPHQSGRKVTWFELFFDLVFVVAVASVAAHLAGNYNFQGVLQSAFMLTVLWWLWLGHTFYSSRFDRERPDQRLVGFVQMLAVIIVGYGGGDAFGGRAWAFAGGIAVFKAMLMFAYLRERSAPGLSRLCRLYARIYAIQAILWCGSIGLDPEVRLWVWIGAFLIDLLSPFIVAGETHRAPPHPEHLPERFGLFTIILLGETAAGAVHALDHGAELHAEAVAIAMLGALLGFLFWMGYFLRAGGGGEREVADEASGRQLRLWAYGHLPLYLGIASLGAGTVHLSHLIGYVAADFFVFSVGAALAMTGITIVSIANAGRSLMSGAPYLPFIGVTICLPLLVPNAIYLLACIAAAALIQLWIAARRTTPATDRLP